MNVMWWNERVGGGLDGESVISGEDSGGKNKRQEYDTSPPLLCRRGGSQRADEQTTDDKASGRFVARGTRPF